MTNIVRLSDNEGSQRPERAATYTLAKSDDDLIAIEKYLIRYGRVPERVFVWRNTMYIPVLEGEK